MKKRLIAILMVLSLTLTLVPTIAIAAEETTSPYAGKIISIMGDSISTFSGHCPDGYRMRYPDSNTACDVKTVDQTWWMQLIDELGATLGISESWAGSTVSNVLDAYSNDRGPDAAMASWTRINNLDANGTPDVILFYGGTNDRTHVGTGTYTLGAFDASTAPTAASGEDVTKWDTVVDAYSDAILRMRSAYPDAEIISILPIDVGNATYEAFNEQIKAVCDHYGVPTVALDSVSSNELYDGVHPSAYGMDIITAEVKAVMTNTEVVLPEKPVVNVDTYLRALPDPAYNTTNLWSNPDSVYYDGSGWATNYPSITIPVDPGDKIYASSFQASSTNGGSQNGIRVTYFAADGTVVSSLTPGAVYSEYSTSDGDYLTVPANATAVNIPMWVDDANSVVYLLTLPDDPNVETPEPENSHLQWVEEGTEVYSDTNLWTALTPENMYYGGSSWVTNYPSITIPVVPGDKIYANSFQAAGTNGGGRNGIRVTYFYGDTVVNSIGPDDVYAEYRANDGYLTVPAGVNAVCIPVWSTDGAVVNLLTLPTRIDTAELTITAPVTGATPVTEVSGTDYTGTVTWNPAVTGSFAANTAYTATVTLTAADGYKFATGFTATVNGEPATVNADGTVSYTFAATEVVEEPKNSHLQWVEEGTEVYSDTNLWKLLTPDAYYYDSNGNWTALSSGESKVYSIVIPVTAGDRIYASSFQSSDKNGSFTPYVQNGIRVTYLNGNEVIKKLSGTQVYTEFSGNNCEYITAPEGVNAVCVPMWVNDENSVVYLLNLPTRVSTADLTITAPVTGATPVTEVSGTGYTGTVTWNPAVTGSFAANTAYTATVTLTAADGYKFAADFTATVNGEPATVNADGTVSYTFAATEVVEEPKNSHLQWVEEGMKVYSDTNLWPLLTPESVYYDGSRWGTVSGVYSVTIPVEAGDRIYANSFQAAGTNGGTRRGIRVTYFYGDTVVSSIGPDDVYTEYHANGYLTVPAGVNAVCIPVWSTDGAVVNLLSLPDAPKGEISGDGDVSTADFTILARYLAGWSGYEEQIVSMEAADVNDDGKVSSADAMILARYVAGWDGYEQYFE